MNELTITPFHKVRWSWDRSSIAPVLASRSRDQSFEASAAGPTESRFLLLETRRNLGPHSMYGMLGANCEPGLPFGEGLLAVKFGNTVNAHRIPWALGAEYDEILFGITDEYHDAILQGALESDALAAMGGCNICFDTGAFSIVNSCRDVFRSLARILIQLLAGKPFPPTEGDIMASFGSATVQ